MPIKDPVKRGEYQKAYRLSHKAEAVTYRAAHYQVNRAAYIEAAVRWNRENPEKRKAITAKWDRLHPEAVATKAHRRRTLKHGNGGDHSTEQRVAKFDELGNRCFYCGAGEDLTIDHLTPLIRGGGNDLENVVPACRPCNSRKGRKTLDEFLDHFKVA